MVELADGGNWADGTPHSSVVDEEDGDSNQAPFFDELEPAGRPDDTSQQTRSQYLTKKCKLWL